MTAALWTSGFRPFFLLGAVYGPLVVVVGWLPLWGGWASEFSLPPALWHGHELIYGFASAFICGFVLTALPSWARTEEVTGLPLAVLTGIWVAGRIASWSYQWIPVALVGTIDLALFAALAALVLPGLLRGLHRRYLALLPILFGFIAANALFFVFLAQGNFDAADRALHGALNLLVVLFAIISGVLTPVFSEAVRQERGDTGPPIAPWMPLEIAAIVFAVLFAVTDWLDAPPALSGTIACSAAFVHAARLSRWRSFSFLRVPLIFGLHVGYAWLVAAMALRGLADAFDLVARTVWIHAFTVGALGMTMLSFANRVALRHTGRIASATTLTIAGLLIMFAAGVARLTANLVDHRAPWLLVSAAAWSLPFALFVIEHGSKLWRKSLPRNGEAVSL
jgi:uncharacterized protein involved in response to NO